MGKKGGPSLPPSFPIPCSGHPMLQLHTSHLHKCSCSSRVQPLAVAPAARNLRRTLYTSYVKTPLAVPIAPSLPLLVLPEICPRQVFPTKAHLNPQIPLPSAPELLLLPQHSPTSRPSSFSTQHLQRPQVSAEQAFSPSFTFWHRFEHYFSVQTRHICTILTRH